MRESLLRSSSTETTKATFGGLRRNCWRWHPDNLAGRYDLISWVPLSQQARLNERGYDQSMLLALSTALALDDGRSSTLRKVREAEKQSQVGNDGEGRANIRGPTG